MAGGHASTHRLTSVLLAVALSGCGGGRSDEPPVDPGIAALGTAITAVGTARADVLLATEAVVAGAVALDDVDEAATAGERAATEAARARSATTTPATAKALAGLPARLTAYSEALDALATAEADARSLDQSQRGLLAAVGTTGAAEVKAVDRLRRTGNGAWSTYSRLDAVSRTWLERSTAGWYRTKAEGRQAYAVLLGDLRAALDKARPALQRADAASRAAARRVSTALKEADAALEPLRP